MAEVPEGKPCVLIELVPAQRDTFVVSVCFANLDPGERVDLAFVETGIHPDGSARSERILGTAQGSLVQHGTTGRCDFLPDAPPSPAAVAGPAAAFRFEAAQGVSDYIFALSADRFDTLEGDEWRVLVRSDSHGMQSPAIPIGRIRRQPELVDEKTANVQHEGGDRVKEVPPVLGGATYDWHAGHEVTFYNDGSTDEHGSGGALHDLTAAIEAAKHFVFVVDWSFHPLFCPSRTSPPSHSNSVGALLLSKTKNPEFVVAIHTWDHTNMGAADAANDGGGATLNTLAHGFRPPNLMWRATSRTGFGWSHHQKFVVLDAPGPGGRRELQVFWGGLDLTKGRFDWPGHPIDQDDAKCAGFRTQWGPSPHAKSTDDWYNLEFADNRELPRQPWHDIHGALKGPAAWDFAREFVGRWSTDASSVGGQGDMGEAHRERVWKVFRKLHEDRSTFVQQFEGKRTGQWCAQVYRSLTLEHWAPPPGVAKDKLDERLRALLRTDRTTQTEESIRLAYQHNIERAERFIYIENQYFLGSGRHWGNRSIDNDIPERLVRRILRAARAREPFHVYVVMPLFPEGDPTGVGNLEVRRSEWKTMEYMVKTIQRALEGAAKWDSYLSFFFLANWRKTATWSKRVHRADLVKDHRRYMIYVHSKLMIVDDRYALFGSCNLNDRGLAGGGDSEIACGVWPSHGAAPVAQEVKAFRRRLWEEHWGEDIPGWDAPELCVASAQARAEANYQSFRTMTAAPQGHICRLPLSYARGGGKMSIRRRSGYPEPFQCLPDSPPDKGAYPELSYSAEWMWDCPGSDFIRARGWAE